MGMHKATFTILGQGELLFSAPIFADKVTDETHAQFEERSWIERASVDDEGGLVVSGFALHQGLVFAGSWLSEKLSGQKTYTKRFAAGVIPAKPHFKLANGKGWLTTKDVHKKALYVPSDGKKGGKKRVHKYFPSLPPGWHADIEMIVLDQAIDEAMFFKHAQTAGLYDGLGAMRAGNAGQNGRYLVQDLKYEPYDLGI